MANRIPLVVDTTDGNKIKELPARDNPDPTNSIQLVGIQPSNTNWGRFIPYPTQ